MHLYLILMGVIFFAALDDRISGRTFTVLALVLSIGYFGFVNLLIGALLGICLAGGLFVWLALVGIVDVDKDPHDRR